MLFEYIYFPASICNRFLVYDGIKGVDLDISLLQLELRGVEKEEDRDSSRGWTGICEPLHILCPVAKCEARVNIIFIIILYYYNNNYYYYRYYYYYYYLLQIIAMKLLY